MMRKETGHLLKRMAKKDHKLLIYRREDWLTNIPLYAISTLHDELASD